MDMTPTGDSGSENRSLAEELPDPEVHVLGSIMVDPTMLKYVAPRIKPEHFQSELHRRIYRTMLYKHDYGISPNLQCLSLEARPSGLLENVGKHTLLEMAQRIATTATIDNSVKSIVERDKRQELDGLQMYGREVLEKQGDVPQIIEMVTPDLDDLETGHETLASPDTDGSQLSRLNVEPRPALLCTMLLPAVDTRPLRRPPRGAAEFGFFSRLDNRVAKPLAMVTLIVGAVAAAWFAGRWSARVAPRPSKRVYAAAPMQDQGVQVASKVLSSAAQAANAEEKAPQQTTTSPAIVPSAGEAQQVSPDVIQPSTPVAPQDDATPRVQAPAPRREGGLIYAVNVSSFRNAEAAAVEVAKLQARGSQARAIRTDLESKGIWYRVYVGHYATEAEAKQARAEILKHTDYGTAYVRAIGSSDRAIGALAHRP